MQPPTEANGEAPEAPGPDEPISSSVTEDKEVAEWVHKQIELRESGLLKDSEKPALHAVALDKVGNSPVNNEDPATPALDG